MRKSHICHKADPHVWEDIRKSGLALLTVCDLEQYRNLVPDNEDLQDKWEAVVGDPAKYITLLIGQKDDDEQIAESDKENSFSVRGIPNNADFFLAYHEVKAHLKWVSSRPADAIAYKRFQVS